MFEEYEDAKFYTSVPNDYLERYKLLKQSNLGLYFATRWYVFQKSFE